MTEEKVGPSVSACLFSSAPEEEGARGAAGGRDPGLREDSHGEEQPPEGPGQDGQRRRSVHSYTFTR